MQQLMPPCSESVPADCAFAKTSLCFGIMLGVTVDNASVEPTLLSRTSDIDAQWRKSFFTILSLEAPSACINSAMKTFHALRFVQSTNPLYFSLSVKKGILI